MTQAILNLHSGGQEVTYEQLAAVETPTATRSWVPIGHAKVLDTAVSTLVEAGYQVVNRRLALARNGARFFGTLDLATELSPDGTVTLAVGLRNSLDKSYPMGFCAGSRVFVCSNLSFRSDLVVKRKHSLYGASRFSADIATAVMNLASFKENESRRIGYMQEAQLTDEQADSFILRSCLDKGVISARHLPTVWKEWREPRHELFQPRTAWSLLNAFTSALSGLQTTNPTDLARRTMRLHALLAPPQN